MAWDFRGGEPIYAQLVSVLRQAIISGTYGPGQKLPSVRELAQEAGVNPNTVQRAYLTLEQAGLICTQRTTGKYVTTEQTVLECARQELAAQQTARYVASMQALGFGTDDILTFIQNRQED